MSFHVARLGTLTIPAGSSVSPNLRLQASLEFVEGLAIYGPAVLTGAIRVQVSFSKDPQEADWMDLKVGGANVVPVAAGMVQIYPLFTVSLRLKSAANEAADRAFGIVGRAALP